MAVVQSGATTDKWTIDPTSKAGRVTLYDTSGNVFPAVGPWGKFSGYYYVATFRTIGVASSPNNLFTLEVPVAAATAILAVESIFVTNTATAVLTSVSPEIALARTTALPTGGTTLTSALGDTGFSATNAVARGATASDGGALSAPTATADARISQGFAGRIHTAVGIVHVPPFELLPEGFIRPLIIRSNEGIVVQTITNTAATDHFLVSCTYREYT